MSILTISLTFGTLLIYAIAFGIVSYRRPRAGRKVPEFYADVDTLALQLILILIPIVGTVIYFARSG